MTPRSHERPPRRLGLVVHPSRDISEPLDAVRGWCERNHVELVQIPEPVSPRHFAPDGKAETCDLLVSIGGDGTMLAAIRAGAAADLPVLGIASGSLGVLTRTPPAETVAALGRVAAGEWVAYELPALKIERPDQPPLHAFNDLAVVRAGVGQIRIAAELDGVLYGRVAGDGAIVSAPLGSSAYTLAARGPLLGPGVSGFVFTPLSSHGGNLPPLVVAEHSRLTLVIGQGYGGARLEVDGQIVADAPSRIEVGLLPGIARLIGFDGQESLLTVLRSRGILVDSPRILVEDARRSSERG